MTTAVIVHQVLCGRCPYVFLRAMTHDLFLYGRILLLWIRLLLRSVVLLHDVVYVLTVRLSVAAMLCAFMWACIATALCLCFLQWCNLVQCCKSHCFICSVAISLFKNNVAV